MGVRDGRELIADFFEFVAVLVTLANIIVCGIMLLAAAVGLAVGAWDGLVWLFKADWHTTNFYVTKIAAVVFGVSLVIVVVLKVVTERLWWLIDHCRPND